jgi:microcystin-dependent protein
MSYSINYSDPTKSAIVVDDYSITGASSNADTTLSVGFIRKNASDYAATLSGNFLHLLENFASPDFPTNPVQGQLWFDSANSLLKINMPQAGGTNWRPASGIWSSSTQPDGMAGDLWVDTSTGQLFINTDGSASWTLIGPAFSSSLKTGSYPDVINDNFGTPHKIIKNYIDDTVVEIISSESFVPQTKINGFTSLLPGINLTSNNGALINATSYSTKNLAVTSPFTANISANNFVRNDIDNTINAALTVLNGVIVGSNSAFKLAINPTSQKESQIINAYNGGKITFVLNNNNYLTTLMNINGFSQNVGIALGSREPNASAALEVGGNAIINGALAATITTVTSLNVTGNTAVSGSQSIGGNLSVTGLVSISSATVSTDAARFTVITATNYFSGNLQGTASLANGLTGVTTWQLTDQLSGVTSNWSGVAGNVTFDAKLTPNAVTSQTVSTLSSATDWTNFYNTGNTFSLLGVATNNTPPTSSQLVQIEKENFLSDIIGKLIPTGTILPWAGGIDNNISYNNLDTNNRIPAGWLLCDGQQVYISKFNALFGVIGYTYNPPGASSTSTFALPDLRGRSIVGYDNMYNGLIPVAAAGRIPGANTPTFTNNGESALVSGGTSTVFLSTGTASTGSGTQVDNATSINVMNPYLAMNYIIKV